VAQAGPLVSQARGTPFVVRMSLPVQQLLKLPYGPQHAEDS